MYLNVSLLLFMFLSFYFCCIDKITTYVVITMYLNINNTYLKSYKIELSRYFSI